MKVYQFRKGRDQGGKTLIEVVDERYVPISPYVSVFISLRQGAVNTQRRAAYELRFFLLFLKSKGIDIDGRAATGEFLTRTEARAFADTALFKFKGDNTDNVIEFERFTNKTLQNAIHSTKISQARVGADTASGRIKTATMYLNFLYEEIHEKFRAPDVVKQNLMIAFDEFKSVNTAILKMDDVITGESVIPTDTFQRLLQIIQPDSSENPFKHSRLRNYLIVALLVNTGIRRGAVVKLKIADCVFHGAGDQLKITRTPDDVSDPRKYRPSQKTKAHAAYVPPALLQTLDEYIQYQRARFAAAEMHEFVFVTELATGGDAGAPLSLQSVNRIFKVLTKALDFNVHPHMLRHKWNEIFSEQCDEIDSNEKERLRKLLMGWSKTSEMVDTYNQASDMKTVRAINAARQDRIANAGDANDSN